MPPRKPSHPLSDNLGNSFWTNIAASFLSEALKMNATELSNLDSDSQSSSDYKVVGSDDLRSKASPHGDDAPKKAALANGDALVDLDLALNAKSVSEDSKGDDAQAVYVVILTAACFSLILLVAALFRIQLRPPSFHSSLSFIITLIATIHAALQVICFFFKWEITYLLVLGLASVESVDLFFIAFVVEASILKDPFVTCLQLIVGVAQFVVCLWWVAPGCNCPSDGLQSDM